LEPPAFDLGIRADVNVYCETRADRTRRLAGARFIAPGGLP
jgi:hypothetical protein